mgnify:CR=1 FL=1
MRYLCLGCARCQQRSGAGLTLSARAPRGLAIELLDQRLGLWPWAETRGRVEVANGAKLDQLAALLDGKPQTLATFDEALAVQRTIEGMLAARA